MLDEHGLIRIALLLTVGMRGAGPLSIDHVVTILAESR